MLVYEIHSYICSFFLYFFFNDTATTEIYTLSLHDALPIWRAWLPRSAAPPHRDWPAERDRKSTRLNSSHMSISYAVFCLKKKNNSTVPEEQKEDKTATLITKATDAKA